MINKIRKWWQGEFVESTLEHILEESKDGAAYMKRPWPGRALSVIGKFLKKEWKWLLAFGVSLAALYIGYLKL